MSAPARKPAAPASPKPAYRAITSLSLGLADGTRVPVNDGDLLPDDWCEVNQHQIAQLLETGTIVRVPDPDPPLRPAA